jgi:hypothetical protein
LADTNSSGEAPKRCSIYSLKAGLIAKSYLENTLEASDTDDS